MEISPRAIVAGVLIVVLAIVGLWSIGSLIEYLPASEIMVIQSPLSGQLNIYTQPGVYWQGFGTVTHYPKRAQVWFSSRKDQGNTVDESLPIRFNDNGKALMSVGISWEMPTDNKHVIDLHTKFGSATAIEKQLVEPVIQKAVYATGPLMSSQESAASRRNDLFQYLEDQIQNGVFRTETFQEKQKDPMTGQDKTVSVVKLILGKDGQPVRADDSPLREFGVRTFNPVINDIKYDEAIEKQIQEQQRAIMSVQTAMAEAKRAEQNAITAAKNGEAEAAKAKWEQEVIKAREVTQAQQRKEVASLEAQAAEFTKQKLILEGQGEAQKRQLLMNADGALAPKLDALIKINGIWADAFAKHQGKIVPDIMWGGSSGSGGNAATDFMNFMNMKAAKDLSVDPRALQPQK